MRARSEMMPVNLARRRRSDAEGEKVFFARPPRPSTGRAFPQEKVAFPQQSSHKIERFIYPLEHESFLTQPPEGGASGEVAGEAEEEDYRRT
jgi:hypothetical protein